MLGFFMYYVYVLKSLNYNRRYIGSCDMDIRLQNHNSGKVRSSKPYRPYQIIYNEVFDARSEAFRREQFFETLDGYNFLKSLDTCQLKAGRVAGCDSLFLRDPSG